MKIVLFHDALALRWSPFIETRPVGELLYGTLTLRERVERALGTEVIGYLGAPHLLGFDEPGSRPVLATHAALGEDRIFLCARAALERAAALPRVRNTATLQIGGQVAGWAVPAGQPAPSAAALAELVPDQAAERVELPGELLARPWDLMSRNAARIAADAAAEPDADHRARLSGVHVLGQQRIILEEGAVVEPGVVLDVRAGPVWLARRTRVEGPARATGPLYLGPDSTILGGPVSTSSIGPVCRVRGEVIDSVILGYSNKAHDGHLGHALLGRWVNLGADTINSDLKNTYSAVHVRLPKGNVNSGLIKVGCFIGDHVKTGIGTLIGTGAVIGAASNVFGGRMPPPYVPPFSWGAGDELVEYRLDRFLATAQSAMSRRAVELTPGMRQVLTQAWERSRGERANRQRGS